jgi:hypothetical protein
VLLDARVLLGSREIVIQEVQVGDLNAVWRTAMTKKAKTVRVGNVTVTPITAKERRRLERKIKTRHEKLRKRYREIHGKVIDWVSHNFEQGSLYVNIRFKDETDFSLRFSPQILIDGIDLSDIRTGDFKMIRKYYIRRDE